MSQKYDPPRHPNRDFSKLNRGAINGDELSDNQHATKITHLNARQGKVDPETLPGHRPNLPDPDQPCNKHADMDKRMNVQHPNYRGVLGYDENKEKFLAIFREHDGVLQDVFEKTQFTRDQYETLCERDDQFAQDIVTIRQSFMNECEDDNAARLRRITRKKIDQVESDLDEGNRVPSADIKNLQEVADRQAVRREKEAERDAERRNRGGGRKLTVAAMPQEAIDAIVEAAKDNEAGYGETDTDDQEETEMNEMNEETEE